MIAIKIFGDHWFGAGTRCICISHRTKRRFVVFNERRTEPRFVHRTADFVTSRRDPVCELRMSSVASESEFRTVRIFTERFIMRFTVQMIDRGSASKDVRWAVLLDNEHVMFVGTYRQCEDWLDAHEIFTPRVRSSNEDSQNGKRAGWSQRMMKFLSDLTTWSTPDTNRNASHGDASADGVNQRRHHLRATTSQSRTSTFLQNDTGYCSAADMIVAAAFIGTVYFGTMFLTLDAAWNTVSSYHPLIQTTRSSLSPGRNAGQSPAVCYCGSLDIACDLASSDH